MKVFLKLIIALLLCTQGFAQQNLSALDSIYTNFDYAPDEPDSVLSARIASINAELPLMFNENVRAFIDMFTLNRRDYTRRVIARQNIYFHIFEEALERHNMPDDLKYLTIVESAIRPTAKSRVGALGLWQFMPATGKMYGLTYNYYTDKRMDPYLATDAACKYLKFLHTMFGDWQMALAAYNCGPGNVRKAIRRSGNKRTFAGIYNYLPKETRGYVPIFMAVNYVFRFHDKHNIHTEKKGSRYSYFEHPINSLVNIEVLADSLNICSDEIAFLNPQVKQTIIPATQQFDLRLPLSVKNKFKAKANDYITAANVAPIVDPADKIVAVRYKVRRGDNLGKIAEKHGVGLSQLKSWNNIGRKNIIHVGQYLTIHTKAKHTNEKVVTASTTKSRNTAAYKSSTYKVRRGDALSTIANKFNISVKDLKRWNNIGSRNIIKQGQVLKISKPIPQVASSTKPTNTNFYIVKKGDTLWSISKKSGISITDLKKFNKLNNSSLKIGQKIKTSKS